MTSRIEVVYRTMYESFTPGMMRRTPLRLKQKMARRLGYYLVSKVGVDDFMMKLFTAKPGEPVPMAISMFNDAAGGDSIRPFFRPRFYWDLARRIWRAQALTPKQLEELGRYKMLSRVTFPGIPEPTEMQHRRRNTELGKRSLLR